MSLPSLYLASCQHSSFQPSIHSKSEDSFGWMDGRKLAAIRPHHRLIKDLYAMSQERLNGRIAFLKLLQDEGVTHIFGNPGTTELALMEAMPDATSIQYVLGLQESIVLSMADGFARAS